MRVHRKVLTILATVAATVVATTTVQAVAQEGPTADPAPPAARTSVAQDIGSGTTETSYVPVAPCRLYDSRQIGSGAAIPSGGRRDVKVRLPDAGSFAAQGGKAGGCGIPEAATSVEVSVSAVSPAGTGFLRAWAGGASEPTATFLNYASGLNLTNTGTVSLCTSGCVAGRDLQFEVNSAATQVVIDVQAYTAKPIAAFVASNGTILRASRVSGIAKVSTGQYLLTVDRRVDQCVTTASVDGTTGTGTAMVGPDAANDHRVYVFTMGPTGLIIDRGFSVHVTC